MNYKNQLPPVESIWRKGDELRKLVGVSLGMVNWVDPRDPDADDSDSWEVCFPREWLEWAADATCVSEGGE